MMRRRGPRKVVVSKTAQEKRRLQAMAAALAAFEAEHGKITDAELAAAERKMAAALPPRNRGRQRTLLIITV